MSHLYALPKPIDLVALINEYLEQLTRDDDEQPLTISCAIGFVLVDLFEIAKIPIPTDLEDWLAKQ